MIDISGNWYNVVRKCDMLPSHHTMNIKVVTPDVKCKCGIKIALVIILYSPGRMEDKLVKISN